MHKPSLLDTARRLLAPKAYWRRKAIAWGTVAEEPELQLLDWACDRRKLSIDVGASRGRFAARLLPRSAGLALFEPRTRELERLRQLFAEAGARVSYFADPLSDSEREVVFRQMANGGGRSTIESDNPLLPGDQIQGIPLRARTLDSFGFPEVGFIKIDVEGHEEAVLRGALGLIERDRPNLLIELEERHKPGCIGSVRSLLARYGYTMWFHDEGLRPGESFDPDTLQNPAHVDGGRVVGKYINNFLFLPPGHPRAAT
jgi:FkbM family methyltransferase